MSDEFLSLVQIKKELQDLGLSSSTPGLSGDERYNELLRRLNAAQSKITSVGTIAVDIASSDSPLISDIKQLNLTEIRSRLSALGISTSTPGLTGEDRWNALMQRLVSAICGAASETPREKEEETQPVSEPSRASANRKPVLH